MAVSSMPIACCADGQPMPMTNVSVLRLYCADDEVPMVTVGIAYADNQICPCQRFLAVSILSGSSSGKVKFPLVLFFRSCFVRLILDIFYDFHEKVCPCNIYCGG
jgi:hypothetical protein